MPTEKELIALIKNDDQIALKQLFDGWHHSLCLTAFKIVQDRDQAKDIVQDVFIKFWKNRKKLEIEGSFGAYMKRATVNTALNHIKRIANFKKAELEKSDLSFFSGNSTDQALNHDELVKKSEYAIMRLPARTRVVFTLIRSEEMSYKEVSITLGISTKAVEKEMMKALKLLREALKEFLFTSILLLISGACL
jgi:RNA polymerase sigma-70 factor (ECF subfamily)